jgi:hypothetical protein
MWKDTLENLSLDDPNALYEPEDNSFIHVTSSGGRIGRLYWHNQGRLKIELFNADGTLHERTVWEVPGGFSFVWTVFDYFVFLME